MSDCPPGVTAAGCAPGPSPFPVTPQVGTRLITFPGDKEALTLNRETDCRTALTRGLAEYLSQLSINFAGGRLLKFKNVFQTWAEPEDVALYPAATVYAPNKGDYDMSRFTPNTPLRATFQDGSRLVVGSEFALDITIDVWANDPPARTGLVAMIEDAMVPVDWRYGPLLELPHYFNQRASFEMVESTYVDGDLLGMQRYRRATIMVKGRVAQTRVLRYVQAIIRANVKNLAPTDALP